MSRSQAVVRGAQLERCSIRVIKPKLLGLQHCPTLHRRSRFTATQHSTDPDPSTSFRLARSDIDDMAPLWPFSGPGYMNDPCLLLGADSSGKDAVTELQSRAQFSM